MTVFIPLLSTADIIVKLRNRGPDAYKKDVYGDSIYVVQRVSSDGSRSCKLKNKSGEVPLMILTIYIKFSLKRKMTGPARG